MTALFWTAVRRCALLAALCTALVLPAAAVAKPSWHALNAPAPGGDSFAVVNGRPVVAYAAADGIHVAKAALNGRSWQQIGAPIRQRAGAPVFSPDLAIDPASGRPWVAWSERDERGIRQVRVARLEGAVWREVAPRVRQPIPELGDPYPESAPDIAFFGARPYVTFAASNPVDVELDAMRLSPDGTRWEGIGGLSRVIRPGGQTLATSGGALYLAVDGTLGPYTFTYRFDPSTSRFVELDGPVQRAFSSPGDIGDLGGAPAVLLTREGGTVEVWALRAGDAWQQVGGVLASGDRVYGTALEGRFVAWIEQGRVRTAYLSGGSWRQIAVSGNPAATTAQLASGAGGTFLLWRDASGRARVARMTGA